MITPNNQSSLSQWIDWLLHLHAKEIDLGLERIRIVANEMQVTRPAPFVITVAGTNGKGSSVAMLTSILLEAGYKVGTYTSPHILEFNERIQVNGESVSDQLIVDAFSKIEQKRKSIKLTYFEFSTLAALSIFTASNLDVIVLEVGLGGRLDAVNVVDADATIITAIDVDHIEWLGDDRDLIAIEKAGVMREGQLSVCSDPNPPQTLIDYAHRNKVHLSLLGIDFTYSSHADDDQAWLFKQAHQEKAVYSLKIPNLEGAFQFQNAAGVVALLLKIKTFLPVSIEAISNGLQKVQHAGRLQRMKIGNQAWLIDVAHNPQSALVLAEFLSCQESPKDGRIAIFSALSDKDMLPMVKVIAPFVDVWAIADLAIPRATSIEVLTQTLLQAGVKKADIEVYGSIDQTVQSVKRYAISDVLVCGSFFTVSQALLSIKESSQKV